MLDDRYQQAVGRWVDLIAELDRMQCSPTTSGEEDANGTIP